MPVLLAHSVNVELFFFGGGGGGIFKCLSLLKDSDHCLLRSFFALSNSAFSIVIALNTTVAWWVVNLPGNDRDPVGIQSTDRYIVARTKWLSYVCFLSVMTG